MPTLELGTFLILNFLGFALLFLFKSYSKVIMLFSCIIFAIIGLYLVSGYDVVITNQANQTEINSNGGTSQNVSSTTEITNVINSAQFGIGYIYFALSLIVFIIFARNAFL